MRLNANALPSLVLELWDWILQLPIDAKGNFSGKAAEVKVLGSYTHKDYFHPGSDGGVVLAAPVDGATTGGSILCPVRIARDELLGPG